MLRIRNGAAVLVVAILCSACGKPRTPPPVAVGERSQEGLASWYGPGFDGKITASGERFDQNKLTAAHFSLPFGTRVRVTNLRNGRSVTVVINDRFPIQTLRKGRIIDLSRGAARVLDMVPDGVVPVRLKILSP